MSGNYEYWWMLDDVKVFAEDPTPNNDLVLGDFFYPVSSYATPESQIATDTFGFYAFVSNRGAVDQYKVTLFAFVFDTLNNVVFEDSAAIAVLPAGYLDTFIQLPNRYVPELGIGRYSVVYAVFSDSTDARPDDNVDGDFFEVTANRFAKERGPTSASQPGSGGDYAFANLYQMSSASQEQYRAVSFVFATAVNPGTIPLEDLEVTASLFKVKDEVLPDFSNFDETAFMSPSLDWVGTAGYEFPTGAANYELQTVEIVDLTTGEVGVLLENGARYFAAVEYAGVNNVAFHATSDETTHYFLSTLVYTEATGWFAGYSDDFNAVIRMNIDLVTSIDEKPLPETALVVMPNPIQTELNLQVGFDQSTDATITIAEVSGRVIKIDRRKGLTNELLTYQLPQLANGLYLARIATAQGTSTKKFVVQK